MHILIPMHPLTTFQTCPDPGVYPTVREFYEAFGGYAIALYIASAVITLILAAEYVYLVS